MSLEKYRRDAILRAEGKVSSRILNDSIGHANILIETMVGMASFGDIIRVYSGSLPEASFFASLSVTKAAKILILLDDDSNLQWLSKLPLEQLKKMEIRRIVRSRPNHFFCVSSGAFRYETDAATFRAEANFYEPKTSELLTTTFDAYCVDSTIVSLPQVGVMRPSLGTL
jgi:hypothetical protein